MDVESDKEIIKQIKRKIVLLDKRKLLKQADKQVFLNILNILEKRIGS